MRGTTFSYGSMLVLAGAVTFATPGLCRAQRLDGGGQVGRVPFGDARGGGYEGNFYRGGYRYGDRPYYGLNGGYPYSNTYANDWPGVTYGSFSTSYSVVPDPQPYDDGPGVTYGSFSTSYSVVPEPVPYDNPGLRRGLGNSGSSGAIPPAYLSSAGGSRTSKLMGPDTAASIAAGVLQPGDSGFLGEVPATYLYGDSSTSPSVGGSRISKLMGPDKIPPITAGVPNPDSGDSSSRGVVPAAYSYGNSATSPSTGASRISKPMQAGTAAHITARVPADAKLWFDGLTTTSTGLVRRFHTPPLTPGSRYAYELRARWNENGQEVTQTQMIEVTARADVEVNFPVPPKTDGSLPSTISRPLQKPDPRP
jgi:uncharacterized protein (TIGR03000 family)